MTDLTRLFCNPHPSTLDSLNGRADLHMHTTASDGRASVRDMLDHAATLPLDVIAITDHDRLEASLWAFAHRHEYPFDIVPGVEVTSAEGHVLALWVTQPIEKGLSLQATAERIHRQGGLAILAHPFEPLIAPHTLWRYLTHPEVLQQSGIDAVEVFNAGAITAGGNALTRAVYAHRLPVVGNSDAHMPDSIGTGVTRFHGTSADDLRKSLVLGMTAVEGTRWQITDYYTLWRRSRQNKRNTFLETNVSSNPLTPQSD
jgi:predicted metal-dependent phosphoesterase TrpH